MSLVSRVMKIARLYLYFLALLVGLYGLFLVLSFFPFIPDMTEARKGFTLVALSAPFFLFGIYCVISSILCFSKYSKKTFKNINISLLILNFGILPTVPKIYFDSLVMSEIYYDAMLMIVSFAFYIINSRIIVHMFKNKGNYSYPKENDK